MPFGPGSINPTVVATRKGLAPMKSLLRQWLILPILAVLGWLGQGPTRAEAQYFGLSYNSPGLSIGINQPAYGGYYPVAPVVVPRPVVVAPPVVYGPRPYYPAPYGYRGGYGGYYGGHHGGYPGPYGPPRRPYY